MVVTAVLISVISSRSEKGRRPSERSEVYKFVARDRVGIARGSLRAVKSRAARIYFDGVRTVA